jgi:hypothetical protein
MVETDGVVYGLHGEDGVVRYVGLTSITVDKRFKQHLSAARDGKKQPVYAWIRSIGLDEVKITVLEQNIPINNLHLKEKEWIEELGTWIHAVPSVGFNVYRSGSSPSRRNNRRFDYSDIMDDVISQWSLDLALVGDIDVSTYDARVYLATRHPEWLLELATRQSSRTLNEFVTVSSLKKNEEVVKKCTICKLDDDLVKEIELARAKEHPTTYRTISLWLENEHGFVVNPATINNHFKALHHERVSR